MMRQIIILWSLSLFYINRVEGQINDSSKNKILQIEKKYFNSNSISEKTNLSFEKFQILINENVATEKECYEEIARIKPDYLNSDSKVKYYWNAAMVCVLHNDYTQAVDMINSYKKIENDTSISFQLLEMFSKLKSPYDIIDVTEVSEELKDIHKCIQFEQNDTSRKDNKYNWCSYVVPGSGMMLKGYIKKGTTSFLLNGLSAYFVILLLHNQLYVNAIGFGLLTFTKFYQGNNVYTKKLVSKRKFKKESEKINSCHKLLNEMLSKNPILFKY